MNEIKLGKYQHYKGNFYKVIGVARHSETDEELVVYQALYADENGKFQVWVRPIKMFLENIIINGKIVPRFKFID